MKTELSARVDAMLPELIEFRHDLHMHPELGYEERRTASRVVAQLERLDGLKVRAGVAGTGIVATLNTGGPGRCVALRADMDALPIQELNTFPHRSRYDGKMHACGHDGHTTCLVGAARVLAASAGTLGGCVTFIFQPAEEGGAGGRRIVDEGALDHPPADVAFAMHGWPDNRIGEVVIGAGPILAATATFDIVLSGTGTHAAFPHNGQDLVLTAAHVVTAIQALSSRLTDPTQPVAVSVTHVDIGNTCNVLPGTGRMRGTVRAMTPETLERLRGGLVRMTESTAAAFGASARVDWHPGYPALVNDPATAALATRVARGVLGDGAVITNPPPCLGGEDFAFYSARAPTVMFRLGVRPPDRPTYPKLHQPTYDFPDDALAPGILMYCHLAIEAMRQGSSGPRP